MHSIDFEALQRVWRTAELSHIRFVRQGHYQLHAGCSLKTMQLAPHDPAAIFEFLNPKHIPQGVYARFNCM